MIENYVDQRRPTWAGEGCTGHGMFGLFDVVMPACSTCPLLWLSRAIFEETGCGKAGGWLADRLFAG